MDKSKINDRNFYEDDSTTKPPLKQPRVASGNQPPEKNFNLGNSSTPIQDVKATEIYKRISTAPHQMHNQTLDSFQSKVQSPARESGFQGLQKNSDQAFKYMNVLPHPS